MTSTETQESRNNDAPIKVYELAKELGMDSLTLLDRLRDLRIPVKSHMSDLTHEQVEATKQALSPKTPVKGTATKAPKKPSQPKTTKSASPTRKKDTSASNEAAAGAKGTPKSTQSTQSADDKQKRAATSSSPASSMIIRRRHSEDATQQTVVRGAQPSSLPQEELDTAQAHSLIGAEQATDSQSEEYAATTESSTEAISTSGAQATAAESPTPTAVPQRGGAAIIRAVAPERRGGLKVVEAAKKTVSPVTSQVRPKAVTDPTLGPGGPRAGVIKMTKEGLDRLVEEEAARKRAAREIGRPEDVNFADYKKRELVFLPKRKKLPVGRELKKTQITKSAAHKRVVDIEDTISVQDLALAMGVRAPDVLKKLIQMGQMATIHQSIDSETAALVAAEFQFEVRNVAFKEEALLDSPLLAELPLVPRPPVVTIMGHVDHGKTSLLDAIRESNVAEGEAGGITQHIGAYTVTKNGKQITFIDTPGHEAFSLMRARGANVTDIVILVIAADDGVMPQTREALNHARAAKVPIIVAMNKIDKPGANPEKIKQQLAELELLAEDWGGETMFVPVSALKKTNLDQLLESILVQAEVLDLKAPVDCQAFGSILEARMEKGRGVVVSVLVKRGKLKTGNAILSGTAKGKVKALFDYKGQSANEVTPGIAVEVLGFESIPIAGDRFDCVSDESLAEKILSHRLNVILKQKSLAGSAKMTLEQLFSKVQAGKAKELAVVLKADVYGSVEAVKESLTKLSTPQVTVNVIHAAAGGITESDILLASASNAVVIGFNVRPESKARQLAESEHIEIKTYQIIYELLDDIRLAMTGLLEKKKVERFLGRAEVRQTFSVPKIGTIAGCGVLEGKITRNASIRLLRDSKIIFEGRLASLKRFKDDAREVAAGFECGMGIENFNDLKPGDVIEAFQIDLIAPTLESAQQASP